MTNARKQDWDPEQYARHARFVSDLGMPVVDLLAPQPGERILDLGCGDGALTIKLQDLGCDVVGIDSSPAMVAAARANGVRAFMMDGASMEFREEFDAVFSNAALHWMADPERVVAGVFTALKPGGRFVGEFGGHGNISTFLNALESALLERGVPARNPWYFPETGEFRRVLEAHGFTVREIDLIPRPTPLDGDLAVWLQIFGQPITAAIPEAERGDFVAEVTESLRPVLQGPDGDWVADYVRLRFYAIKAVGPS